MADKSFAEFVEECRKKRSSRTIHNISKEHAAVIIKNLFQVAIEDKKNIKIVSGELDNEFYGALKDDIEVAMEKGCGVDLAVLNEHSNLDENSFASAIKSHKNGIVSQGKSPMDPCYHFVLVGDRSFRVETDHRKTKAFASFDNPEVGGFLGGYFDMIKSCLQPVSAAD